MGIGKASIRSFVFLSSFLLFMLTACTNPVPQGSHSNISKQASPTSSFQNMNQSSSPIQVQGAKEAQVSFTQVDFLNQKNGWVTGFVTTEQGNQQVILWHTTDGGEHWTRQSSPFARLSAILLDLSGTGWAIASTSCSNGKCTPDKLFYTSDGGARWTQQWKSQGSLSNGRTSLQQINDQTAYALLNKKLLKTTDRGAKWSLLSGFNWKPEQMYFVSENTGWVTGGNGSHPLLYKTVDGGNHWLKETVPSLKGGTTGIQGVSFINATTGWVLVSSTKTFRGALYHTSDGGQHWQYLSDVQPFRPYAQSVHFVNGKTGIIPLNTGAGPIAGGVMITHDGGKHFDSVGMKQGWSINDAEMVTDQEGWAVGGFDQNSYLLHTVDGGKSWTQVMPAIQPRQGIQFVDAAHGFGLGTSSDPNAVLATKDDGKTWKIRYSFSHNDQVRSLSFSDDQNGMVILHNTQTHHLNSFKTTDGGKTWRPTTQPPQPNGFSGRYIHLFNHQDGIIQVTESPNFAFSFTHDGGKLWNKVSLVKDNPPGSQYAVSFLSPKDGYLFISSGGQIQIYLTSDGKEWKEFKSIENLSKNLFQLVSAQMVTDQIGYVLTEDESSPTPQQYDLWKTSDGGKTWSDWKFPKQIDFRSHYVSMSFTNVNNGWIESEDGILQTTDGGKVWSWIK